MSKVFCIGESLIDFLPIDSQNLEFKAKAGGAPCNVCTAVAKLGGEGYYIGKLSNDVFSRFLIDNMHKFGVKTDYMVIDDRYQTALAFVTLDANGDREFNFYRKDSCDLMLDESEIKDVFTSQDALHFCSVGLVESKSKYAHKKAIELARQKGALVSFDVNIRANLWDSLASCVNAIKEFVPYADIIKVADDELVAITDVNDEKTAVKTLFALAKECKLLFVTKGDKGSAVYDRELNSIAVDVVKGKVVDTTGAGDCYIGSVLYCLLYKGATLTIDGIERAVKFATHACSKVVSKAGAMEAMPTYDEVGFEY